jgi:hypothetical protein
VAREVAGELEECERSAALQWPLHLAEEARE